MGEKAWKAYERRIAEWWPNATRRGADFRDTDGGGKTDIICPGWAIEVKLYRKPTFGLLLDTVNQAEKNKRNPDDIPVGVVKKFRVDDKNSLVVMRLDRFTEFFGEPDGVELIAKRPTWEQIVSAVLLAEREENFPAAVVTRYGDELSLVVMRLEQFSAYFINQTTDERGVVQIEPESAGLVYQAGDGVPVLVTHQ